MISNKYRDILSQFKTKRVKQVFGLLSVNIVAIPIGIITSIIVTRYLGAVGYGNYMFLLSIFNFAILVFDFGFLQAGNRALVLSDEPQKNREYYGAELICLFILFLVMSFFLVIYGHYDQNLSNKGIANIFFWLIPFGWLFLLPRYYESLFQADNRIKELAISRLFPPFGHMLFCLIIVLFLLDRQVNRLSVILTLYLFPFFLSFIYLILRIRPSFRYVGKRLQEIWEFNKSYGFHVYSGSVLAVGMSQLSGVLISYFGFDNSGVGYYSLAITISAPLKLIPNTIATTHYRDFSTLRALPARLTRFTVILSLCVWILLCMLTPFFVRYFYGRDFMPVVRLVLVASAGMLLYGMADYINRFLGANGKGKALRNSAVLVGITLLVANIVLIPLFKEFGAALAQIFSGAVYLACMLGYYRNCIQAKN